MERLQKREHLIAPSAIRMWALLPESAGSFDQPIIGLSSGVGEKNLPGELHVMLVNLLCQLRLQGMLIEI
jgi:hypothetical protein